MATWDDNVDPRNEIDGVKVLRICRCGSGLPGLRFFHPHWSSLIRALRAADADVYYHNGAECVTGMVALWCRRNRRRFVFSSAADADVERGLPAMRGLHNRFLYRTGLRLADRIIVQNEKQRRLLAEGFGLTGTILPMPCPEESPGTFVERKPHDKPRVLWVGRISPVKRLEWLIDLAEQTPNLAFDVVGPADASEYPAPVIARAQKVANITLHGRKNRRELDVLYRGADVLCCTSVREGFPNTFLEAWSHGLPVVSTLDVDDRIRQLGLGCVAPTVPQLRRAIVELVQDSARWCEVSLRARRYFADNHALDVTMPRFAEVLTQGLSCS